MRFVLPLAKALYIGPRGGRWADAAHTIPYDADKDQDRPPEKERDQHEVRKIVFHPPKAMFGHDRGPQTVYVRRLESGKDRISQNPEAEFGPVMPLESVKHFLNDLSGVVQGPKAKDPRVNAVLDGKAKLLGKGDDGIAYKVGDDVVKVSTTVPYQPMNPGHRTPQQAKDMLRKQHEITEEMISKGVQGLQHSEFVDNGDKGFQIKEWVEIPEKWTADQLSQVQDILIDMHKKGYALNDAIQPGITKAGKVVMMDVGKASRIDPDDPKERGIYGRITNDMDALKYFYRESGVPFARKDIDEGAKAWEKVQELLERDVPVGFIRLHAKIAVDKRKEVAQATLKGKELEDALEDIDFELEDLEYDLKVHEKKFGKSLPLVVPLGKLRKAEQLGLFGTPPKKAPKAPKKAKTSRKGKAPAKASKPRKSNVPASGGPYYGPRGGKWADPKLTISWKDRNKVRNPSAGSSPKQKAKVAAPLKRERWKILKITDSRERDWITGKIVPESGIERECARCGRLHKVYWTMRSESGKVVSVGSGCGPKLIGGADLIDAASLRAAKNELKEREREKAQKVVDDWTAQAWKALEGLSALPGIVEFGPDSPEVADATHLKDITILAIAGEPSVKVYYHGPRFGIPYSERVRDLLQSWLRGQVMGAIQSVFKDQTPREVMRKWKWGLPFSEKRRHRQTTDPIGYMRDQLSARMRDRFGRAIERKAVELDQERSMKLRGA